MRPVLLVLAMALTVTAQAQAGSDWTKVQAIRSGTLIRVSARRGPLSCTFVSADTDSLTCTRTSSFLFIPITHRLAFTRTEVHYVKLSHQFLSGLAGAGIGAGAGAGIGAGLESQQASGEDGHLLTAFSAVLGAVIGATVGSLTDFLAGRIVYRAP